MEPLQALRTVVVMGDNSSRETEALAWTRAVAGDADAFGWIFRIHADRVFGHSLRLTRSAADADDVTALVFLEAWRKRSSVRVVDGSVIGWLLLTANFTARNLSRSLRRQRDALARLPPPIEEDDHAVATGQRLDDETRDRDVREGYRTLSAADQDVLALCVLEGLTLAQAAAVLRIPVGTVKSRLSRAKQRLAKAVPATNLRPHATTEGVDYDTATK